MKDSLDTKDIELIINALEHYMIYTPIVGKRCKETAEYLKHILDLERLKVS